MSKAYKIKLNQGQGEAKFLDIPQVGGLDKALTVKAVAGGKYQLVEVGTGYAPENIRAMRSGKNLLVFFEGRNTADLMIEDYYDVTPVGFNGLIGEAESGRFYEYIPETAVGYSTVPLLAEGSAQVGMALGGAEVFASGAAVGTLVAAAGLNPLLLAPLALLGAGGGGGGSGDPDTTPPKIESAQLLPEDDTGPKDNVTSDTTPRIEVKTEPNADVSVEVNGKTYTGKADKDGLAVVQIPDADALKAGKYTPKITASDAAGNKSAPFDGVPFEVNTPDTTPPEVKSAQLLPEDDTGPKDNVTSDTTPRIEVQTEPNADVSVDVNGKAYTGKADKDGLAVIQIPDADALKDGAYTPKVTATDAAGNKATFDGKPFKISTGDPEGPNAGAVVDIKAIDVDSGKNKTDFYTNDNQLVLSGTVKGFTDNGDWLRLDLKDVAGKVIDSQYVKLVAPVLPATDWSWSWDRSAKEKMVDGKYELVASVVDGAGNVIGKAGSLVTDVQAITIDTDKDNNYGAGNPGKEADLNKVSKIVIEKMDLDTGVSGTDFVTQDRTHTYSGKLIDFTDNGALVEVSLKDAAGKVLASDYVVPKLVADQWTWSWDQTANSLKDGEYTLSASLVDKAGNAITSDDPQKVVVDNSLTQNGPLADPNANLKMGPVSISEDTGSKNNDYLTNDQILTFKGGFNGSFVDNGDKVRVQIFGSDGLVVSEKYVLPTDKAWQFDNLEELGAKDVGTLIKGEKFTVKAVLMDAAGNTLQATDQTFVIDRKAEIDKKFSQTGSEIKYIAYSSVEAGSYTYTTGVGAETKTKNYTGGFFDLGDLKDKQFLKDAFRITFRDLAGNEETVKNSEEAWNFSLTEQLPALPAPLIPGFIDNKLVGSVGQITLNSGDPKELDMSKLYDGIENLKVCAINHVDLVQGDHILKLTMGDVLSLGVTNSFSTSVPHVGKLQMRIDGDATDKVLLDDLVGETDFDWNSNNSNVTIEGSSYKVYTQDTLGLSLFVNSAIPPSNIYMV
jgi:hypothetical protein